MRAFLLSAAAVPCEIARNFRVAQTGHFIEFRANRTLYRLRRIRTLYGFLPTKYQIVRGARHSRRVSGADCAQIHAFITSSTLHKTQA